MGRRTEITDRIRDSRVIAIVRTSGRRAAVDAARAVLDGGLPVVEVALTTPDAVGAIGELAAVDDGRLVGAGTVLTAEDAAAVIDAGARFLVSPAVVAAVIDAGHAADVPVVPGALTPTEIVSATDAGADLVKLFPAATVGIGHLRALRAALPDVGLVPTGGVTVADAAAWLDAGAVAVGVGSALTGGDPDAISRRTAELVAAVT